MNLLLFLLVLVVSFIAVRIGAIAFHLTGLEWSMAKFQSLSCFTSTGFTTREAEMITSSPQRRRIASILIVLGHAGLVTLIATFANSIGPQQVGWSIPFLRTSLSPWLLQFINLAILVAGTYIIFKLLTGTRIAHKLTHILRQRLIKQELVKQVSFEELAVVTGGYGVSKIVVCKDSSVLNKTLAESGLRGRDITVLAVVRAGETMPNPPASTMITVGDELICFGKLDNIREGICTTAEAGQ